MRLAKLFERETPALGKLHLAISGGLRLRRNGVQLRPLVAPYGAHRYPHMSIARHMVFSTAIMLVFANLSWPCIEEPSLRTYP